jgi:hypothetical protein
MSLGCMPSQFAPFYSVPVPSRAPNNEVACFVIHALDLECTIRPTGLTKASHLNGREGVILGSGLGMRWRARLDGSTNVAVMSFNFMHLRGNCKRISP